MAEKGWDWVADAARAQRRPMWIPMMAAAAQHDRVVLSPRRLQQQQHTPSPDRDRHGRRTYLNMVPMFPPPIHAVSDLNMKLLIHFIDLSKFFYVKTINITTKWSLNKRGGSIKNTYWCSDGKWFSMVGIICMRQYNSILQLQFLNIGLRSLFN